MTSSGQEKSLWEEETGNENSSLPSCARITFGSRLMRDALERFPANYDLLRKIGEEASGKLSSVRKPANQKVHKSMHQKEQETRPADNIDHSARQLAGRSVGEIVSNIHIRRKMASV